MAHKDEIKQDAIEQQPVVHSAPGALESNTAPHAGHYHYPHRRIGVATGIMIGVAGILVLLLIAAALTAALHTGRYAHTMPSTQSYHMRPMQQGGLDRSSRGLAAGKSRLSGVVAAVSGSTITVAGNGQSTQVSVDDNTTYAGATKPAAVNDNITVTGTAGSNTTFTATAVRLVRQ